MPTVSPQTALGTLAAEHPGTVPVLWDLGLDFCCGGRQSLSEACAAQALPVDDVLARLDGALARQSPEPSWASAPLVDVIQHLLDRFHAPMAGDLNRLKAMAAKLVRVHGHKAPSLAKIEAIVHALEADLLPHLQKEERVLFPLILSGRGRLAGGPVHVMHLEHEAAGGLLAELRALTDDHTPPPDACGTWRGFYAALKTFEGELMQHIHLENNVLFPRALRGESPLS